MPIHYRYDSDRNILFSTAEGSLTPADSLESHRQVADYARQHPGLRLCVDMRQARFVASPTEVLETIQAFYRTVGARMPVAFVLSDGANDANPMLVETQAYNEGGRLRLFREADDATAWLASQ
jgi:hypothetical protein